MTAENSLFPEFPANRPDRPASNGQMGDDDAAVMYRVKSGDTESFRIIVERHSRAVFTLAYRMTGNEHDAEDIVQETFMKAYRNMQSFEGRATVGTWLHRIAANSALDLLRARKRTDDLVAVSDEPSGHESLPSTERPPDDAVHGAEIRKNVVAAMASLSTIERMAFVLRHFEEMSIAEIGATLGLNENAVKNTIFRAVQKIRRTLQPILSELL